MKKVLVVAALLAVMLIVRNLKQLGVPHAATLAGIGFVILAAYAVAELGKSLSLPQVTGYILAGVVLGPSVGGIISGEVVGEMRMFNTLALGLIAISAGLELDVRQLIRLGKTLLLTTLVKVVVGISLVAGALWLVETSLGSLKLESRGQVATLALILGVLSLGTSPSITLAVLRETRAKGRLSDLVLGAAVFKDLVVVVGLAVAVAMGRVLLQPRAVLDGGVLAAVAFELVGSLAAGGIVGVIFILYVRFIGAEMLLFISAMILVVAELCRAFHLELLLVFIAAGFVVRNFSRFEHALVRPLELVALPVFVVFFANAGASIDLATTWQILPVALALCAARAVAYILASRLGGKWAGESAAIQKHAWLAYLPQAGVTLGLVGLAGLQLPELVTPITNTGMAVVALNLLIGPITLRRALSLAGELPKLDAESGASEASLRPSETTTVQLSAEPQVEPSPITLALPERLLRARASLAEACRRVLQRFALEVEPGLPALPSPGDEAPELDAFRQVVVAHRSAYQSLYADLTSVLGHLPRLIDSDSEGEPDRGTTDTRWGVERRRKLPLRRMARIALGPAMARHVARSFEEGLRGRAVPERRMAGVVPPAAGGDTTKLPPELEEGLERFTELMRDAGTPRLPARRLRYSQVEPQIRQLLQNLDGEGTADLVRLVRARWGSDLLELRRGQLTVLLCEVVSRCMVTPAMSITLKVKPAIDVLADWLERQRHGFDSEPMSASALGQLRTDFDKLRTSALGELSREFRFAATVRATLSELKASVAEIPNSIDCLLLEPGAPLSKGRVQAVQLRSHVDTFIRHIMPPLDLAAGSVSAELSQVQRRVDDAIRPAWTLLEAQVDLVEAREIQTLANEYLSQARRQVERVTRVTVRAVQAALDALSASLDAASAAFAADTLPGLPTLASRDARFKSQVLRLDRALRQAWNSIRVNFSEVTPLRDAAAVRRALGSTLAPPPEVVQRWFDSSPVSDGRLFSAHRRLLEQILDADSTRAETGHASVLILGSKGSGKSSLLNMCELELPSASHVRLHASDFARESTLFEALGTLLESPPTHAGLSRHIALRRPAIFVDDLGPWISSSLDHQRELRRLLHLVAQTRGDAFWLVSVDESMLQLLNELDDVGEIFSHIVRLPPLTLTEVKRLVNSRLELLNADVTFQSSPWTRVVDKLTRSHESERFYRAIWAASAGIPARAVSLCRGAFSVRGQSLTLRADAVVAPDLPAYDFNAVQLAVLATLHRYGPQPFSVLERELAVSNERLQRSVAFLTSCGLVTLVDEGHALSIAGPADAIVCETLVSFRLARG